MTNPTPRRYRAFISYSQRDRQHAKRLHSALESYRVPKGTDATLPPDRRLGRFFRDDDEMGASTDLGGALRSALEDSENLIVICSPHAARSKWVNAEVLHFRSLGRGGRVLTVIVDGVPNSGDPETECFPPALRPEAAGGELLSSQRAEPLGIDLRKEQFERSRIRLAAGLLGVNFDSLWQRDRRRAAKRRAVAAAATLVLGGVITVLGVQWFRERGRVRAQGIDRALVGLRDDLASERVKPALDALGKLYSQGERGAVEDVLTKTLAWASTPAELLKEVKPPAFITNGAQLVFLAADGSRHPMNIHQPYRRILSSDKRRLLILGPDEAVMLDVADGRELARAGAGGIRWHGHAFETGSGLFVVVGRFSGISNGSFRESFLVFSPRRQTLSVFDQHWSADGRGQYRFIHPLHVGGGCRSFGIVREDFAFEDEGATPGASDMVFLSADAEGLKPSASAGSLEGWRSARVFEFSEDELGLERYNMGDDLIREAGCVAPAADSARAPIPPAMQPASTGPARPVGLGAFWESERRWKVVGQVAEEPPSPRVGGGNPVDDHTPCTEERPCLVRDTVSGEESEEPAGGDWTTATPPRGVPRSDRSFDRVENEFVYASHAQYNGGLVSDWCRNLNPKTVCLRIATGVELMEDETDVELRSNAGRLVFYPRGGAEGFRLYDLSTMRDVTPRGPELVVSTHHADFGPDDKRLFVALNGRLLVFAPSPDGGRWQPSGEGAAQVPALSGSTDDKVAGLLALDDASLLSVRASGTVSRFDWRTGQPSWARKVGGVGEVYRVAVSRNRRFLLVVGREGARLLDTGDGLVLSGVLVPPPSMAGSVETAECLKQVFVTDAGVVETTCGEKEYRREQAAFAGDVPSRLRELLSD